MTMLKRVFAAQSTTVGPREVEVVMSTGAIARDGHVLVPSGAQLANFKRNPVVLFSHDPSSPIARASNISVGKSNITATITFPPAGISPKADEVLGLLKSSILNSVSVGFDPIDATPLDPKKPYGGQRFTKWELMELSVVAVPADVGAVVTARALKRKPMTQAIRSGKRLSAESASSIKLALQHHRVAMKSQRDGANVLSQMLRDDMAVDDGGDGEERARALLRLQILRRRQPQLDQIRHLRQLGSVGERAKLLQRAIARRQL